MSRREWNIRLKEYAKASDARALGQILNTVLPYLALLTLSLYSFDHQVYWLFIPLALMGGVFMVRTFIIFHDCTHESFVTTKKGNYIIGHLTGILAFSPYQAWKRDHGIHHGAVGNLNRRGVGDVWTLTVEEYKEKAWYVKALYRLFRNPVFLFGFAPYFLFMIIHRIPSLKSSKKELISYFYTNAGILLMALGYSRTFGLLNYFLVQSMVLFVAAGIGVWLFYVQHQFEEVYWAKEGDYNSVEAALKGSSYYQLPLIFEWLSGYIGYHHIHHLNSKIPNYYLKKCYNTFNELKNVKTVNLRESLSLAFLQIYDVKRKRLISFGRLDMN